MYLYSVYVICICFSSDCILKSWVWRRITWKNIVSMLPQFFVGAPHIYMDAPYSPEIWLCHQWRHLFLLLIHLKSALSWVTTTMFCWSVTFKNKNKKRIRIRITLFYIELKITFTSCKLFTDEMIFTIYTHNVLVIWKMGER